MADGRTQDVYLSLCIRKSGDAGRTDEYGNYIFEVEASNENLDLQKQIVLQRALLESKDNFLKYGVISNDHQHRRTDANGASITDNSQIIGEPMDIRTEGTSTYVVGKLYHSNEHAQEFIRLLKDGSTRVRASIGGIFAETEPDAEAENGKVTHVLWNDLALTMMPVNNTVGHAEFVRSMDSGEFVKALSAGHGTDHAAFSGGRAAVPEDAGGKAAEARDKESGEADALRELAGLIRSGGICTAEEAEGFLKGKGFDCARAGMAAREIINQGEVTMKKSVAERIEELKKSLGGGKGEPEGKTPAKGDADADELELDIDDDDDGKGKDDDDDDDDEGGIGKSAKKSLGDDDLIDASGVIDGLRKEVDGLKKSMEDISAGIVGIGEMVARIAGQEEPRRSVQFTKSLADGGQVSAVPDERPTREDFERVQDILMKSVRDGEITLAESSMMSSEFQRAMAGAGKVSQKTYGFLAGKYFGGK